MKGSRLAKSEWLTCYLNTKFYNVPNNIRITASRFTDDDRQNYLIKGHEYGLKHDFDKITKSHLHYKLGEKKCLELLVVDGKADDIKELIRQLQVSGEVDNIKLVRT